nr:hypothetical protein [Micromonospora sp. DSM 115978]
MAAEIEGHPDNVAAAVYGGFTVAWTEADGARALRVDPDSSLRPVVFVPSVRQSTEASRGALPIQLDHADAAWNVGRAALLAVAVAGGAEAAASAGKRAGGSTGGGAADQAYRDAALAGLLFAATEDRLHQPFRLPNVPNTKNLVEHLRTRGIAAVLSGSGPTVI